MLKNVRQSPNKRGRYELNKKRRCKNRRFFTRFDGDERVKNEKTVKKYEKTLAKKVKKRYDSNINTKYGRKSASKVQGEK